MKLPSESFPNTIPVELFKTDTQTPKPVPIATLLVPVAEVRDDAVHYQLKEKRFSIVIRLGIDEHGLPAKLTPEDVSFKRNKEEPGAQDLTLVVSKVVRAFNAPKVEDLL